MNQVFLKDISHARFLVAVTERWSGKEMLLKNSYDSQYVILLK